MRARLILAVVLILFSTTVSNYSQENVLKPKKPVVDIVEPINYYRVGFGIEAGLNYNMYSQSLTWSQEIPNSVFNVFEKASGLSPYFAAIIDFPISIDNKYGLQVKLAYEGRAYDNSYTGIVDCQEVISGSVFDAPQSNKVEVSGADFGASLMLRYNVTSEFQITVGPMMLMPLGNYNQKLTSTLLSEECYFNFGTEFESKVQVIEGELDNIETRYGIDFGLSYMIPISDNVMLAPSVRLNYMLTNISDNVVTTDNTRLNNFGSALLAAENSMLHSLKFAIGLWF